MVSKYTPLKIIEKSKMDVSDKSRFVCVLLFGEDRFPDVYIIPATAWLEFNYAFGASYAFKGKKPVWRLALSKKSRPILDGYRIETYIDRL